MIEKTKDTEILLERATELCKKLNRRHICEDVLFASFFPVYNLSSALILERLGIPEEILSKSAISVAEELRKNKNIGFNYSPNVREVIDAATYLAELDGEPLSPHHILGGMVTCIPKSLKEFEITADILSEAYLGFQNDDPLPTNEFNDGMDNMVSMFDENPVLSRFAENLNIKASQGEFDEIVDYDNKVEELITILCKKQKPNPILIGEAGVGKTSLVQLLAQRIVNNQVPDLLANKVIYSLSLSSMIAGTEFRGQFEKRMEELVEELKKYDNLIVFIDEIHTLVGAGNTQENMLDASNILKPDLARGTISCIGATTISEYKKTIKKDAALDRRFEKVLVREPSSKEMEDILPIIISQYEHVHKVKFSDGFKESVIDYCDKFFPNRRYPDKIVDVIDTCGAKVKVNYYNISDIIKQKRDIMFNGQTELSKEVLLDFCEELQQAHDNINANVPTVEKEELDKYFKKHVNPIYKLCYDKSLQKELRRQVVGQDKACIEFINGLQSQLYGVDVEKSGKTPSAFLIYGPDGSGKTLFCDVISDLLKEDGTNIIKMSGVELSDYNARYKIISDYPNEDSLAERVLINPTSCIFVDGFDKCNTEVINLFRKILTKGHLSLRSGEIADFSNCQIIITCDSKNKSELGFQNASETSLSPVVDLGNLCHNLLLQEPTERSLRRVIYNKLVRLNRNLKTSGDVKVNFNFDILKQLSKKAINGDKNYIERLFSKKIPEYIINEINKGNKNISITHLI